MPASCSDRHSIEVLAEEFVGRYRKGERPPFSEYTQRYPELANEIADLFPAILILEKLKPAVNSNDSESHDAVQSVAAAFTPREAFA